MRLLFEIGMEELPARFLVQTLKEMKNSLANSLNEKRVKFKNIDIFGTPRRLVVLVNGMAEKQEDLDILNMGPARQIAYNENGEISRAGLGFAKSQNVEPKDLELISTPKGEYVAVKRFQKGEETKALLPELLKELVIEMTFPKSMRWGERKLRFARPIQWFLALFNDEVVEFEIEEIKSGRVSRGHRFFGSIFEANTIDEYFSKIRENNVIIDIDERKNLIREMIEKNCQGMEEKVLIEKELLDEVTNLVEYPFPIVGTFSSDFLEVPQEALIISMQVHQRYFPVLDLKGKLLPKFVVIRNGIEFSENVLKGNEKVLSARLADARFFYQEDLKKPLTENVEKLKNVVFQKDLGTIYDKIERMQKLADYLIDELKLKENSGNIKRTVELCKADLVSNMIGEKEFTKLQGFMGAEYALKSGENEFVSKGIEEHYYPRYQGDKLPKGIEGIITGIVDRIDTLCGCFGVGIIPTGSKDPFALRRATLGIINIVLGAKLEINLEKLIEKSLDILEEGKVLISNKEETKLEIIEFLKQRMLNLFVEFGNSKDIVSAVLDKSFENLVDVELKIKALEEFIKLDRFNNLISLIKRVANILKDFDAINLELNKKLFKEEIEKELYAETKKVEVVVNELIEKKQYVEYLNTLLTMENIINRYFSSVMIMDENEEIKNNRLLQLNEMNALFNRIVNLNLIDEKN